MASPASQPTEIRTARLLLRQPTMDDLEAYIAVATDPEYAFFGSSADPTPESVARGLERIVAADRRRRVEFAIVQAGEVVGRVSLDVDRENETAALGYGIARPWWGRGLASEAAQAALDYAFGDLGLAKVWARVDPRNVGSVRVLEKLGMQREGLLRSHVVRRGERVDRAHYGLLREEWIAGPRRDRRSVG